MSRRRALLATPPPRVSDDASAAGDTLIDRADDKLARQYAVSRGAIVLHAGLSVSAEDGAAALRIQLIVRLRRGISNERHAEWCRQRMEQQQCKAQCKQQQSHHGSSSIEPLGSAATIPCWKWTRESSPVSFAPARAAPFGRAPLRLGRLIGRLKIAVMAPAIIPREARRQRRRGTAASADDPCAAPADCERSAARPSCPRAPLPAPRDKSRTDGPTTAD